MASGDISDGLLTKVRSILDEATAGFYTDVEIYNFLDMGQNECIQILLGKQREKRKVEPDYSHPSLVNSILKTYAITTSTANYYALPSDFLQMELVQMADATATTRFLTMSPLPYHELIKRATNTYGQHSYSSSTYTGQVYYSIIGANLQTSFASFPNGDFSKINIWYYYQPSAISTSVDPTLKQETYEAIINIACSYAHSKDNDLERAKFHLVKAQNILNSL